MFLSNFLDEANDQSMVDDSHAHIDGGTIERRKSSRHRTSTVPIAASSSRARVVVKKRKYQKGVPSLSKSKSRSHSVSRDIPTIAGSRNLPLVIGNIYLKTEHINLQELMVIYSYIY
jgi:hypothetical protein